MADHRRSQRRDNVEAPAAHWRSPRDRDRRILAEIEALPATEAAQLIGDRSAQAPAEGIRDRAYEGGTGCRCRNAARASTHLASHARDSDSVPEVSAGVLCPRGTDRCGVRRKVSCHPTEGSRR